MLWTVEKIQHCLELDREAFENIRQTAEEYCEQQFGNQVYVRGLIEFSNYCKCSCHYCGLRKENQKITRYRLEKEAIIGCVEEAYQEGYRSFVLQSGEDSYYTTTKLIEIVSTIKAMGDIAVTLSIGERDDETYAKLKACGVDRFLIKHECADETIYNALHPHSSFEERIRCLRTLYQEGYQVGSGFMIGLPGQTTRTIAEDIWLLKTLHVHMAGIGPFIPHPQTVLAGESSGSSELTLRAVSLARLLIPGILLPVTTALGVKDEQNKARCLHHGANVVMQKLEPSELRNLYELYPKEKIECHTIREEKEVLETWLASCGKKAIFGRGDAKGF